MLNAAKNRSIPYFKNLKIYVNFVCLPAIRPNCARCMTPEISINRGNRCRFTKLLFQLSLSTAPYPSWSFFIPLNKVGSMLNKLTASAYDVTQKYCLHVTMLQPLKILLQMCHVTCSLLATSWTSNMCDYIHAQIELSQFCMLFPAALLC